MVFKKKMKLSLIIKVNVMSLSFFMILYNVIILLYSSPFDYDEHAALLVGCSMPGNCHHHKEHGIKKEKPSFMKGIIGKWTRIATVNMDDEDISHWSARIEPVSFDQVSETIEWKDLFPDWIDEEEENSEPSCPEIPMPDLNNKHVERADVIVAKLPCRFPEGGWNRDVFRLQVHLVAAKLASSSTYISNIEVERKTRKPRPREAYATVLHSSEMYVCGAITLAQSLIRSGTHRDLILLIDTSISKPKRVALARAGWTLQFIERISNPRADKYSYNKYNYSKFRLWQFTNYDKIVFIDSDILVLRNLDILFHLLQMSATGNSRSVFNSGIMVIEPSNSTFRMLMQRRDEIVSYNGGDQGYLNEVFVWWHRLPRRVNFLKHFWSNSSTEATVKNRLFGSDPPELYSIHYLGLKPWECYRDYDCNWNVQDQRIYASDRAMKGRLQGR